MWRIKWLNSSIYLMFFNDEDFNYGKCIWSVLFLELVYGLWRVFMEVLIVEYWLIDNSVKFWKKNILRLYSNKIRKNRNK